MMLDLRFQIGDVCWRSTWSSAENYVTCPDCGGTGQIAVIMHDKTEHSIECDNCKRGYDPPTGRVRVYDRIGVAEKVFINGISVSGDKIEYRTSTSHLIAEDVLFDNEQSALAHAASRVVEIDREERDGIQNKEKDTRSWAWNASYHRRCIKTAEKEITYHTAKLNVAKIKAKEKSDA